MPVEIGKITRIAAPERDLRRLYDGATGLAHLSQARIDVFLRSRVVGDGKASEAGAVGGYPSVLREFGSRKQRQHDRPALEERHAPGLREGAAPAELFKEFRAFREVAHAECDQAESLFHITMIPDLA